MKMDINSVVSTAKQIMGIAAVICGCVLLAKTAGVQITFLRSSGLELAAITAALALASK